MKISTIGFLTRGHEFPFVYDLYSFGSNNAPIIAFLILFFPILPFWSYFLVDILTYIRKIQIEKKYQNKESKDRLKILDPYPVLNLGQIEHVFLDKTGTITQNNFKIKMIYFNSNLYKFHCKKFLKNIEKNKIDLNRKTIIIPQKKKSADFNLIPSLILQNKDNFQEFNDYPKKEPLTNFLEMPTYSIEKYSPILNLNRDSARNINIPNQLPNPNQRKFFPSPQNKQIVSFNKNRITIGDSSIVNENEENNNNSNKNRLELSSPRENDRFLKFNNRKKQKISEDNICFETCIGRKSPTFKISFDLSSETSSLKKFHRIGSSNSSLRSLLLNDIKIQKFIPCTEDDFLNSLLTKPDYLDPLFEAMSLCHSARMSNDNKILTIRPEEEVIMNFCGLFTHKFEKANLNAETCEYHIRVHQRKMIYNIYHVNEFIDHKNFSILYQDPKNYNQSILLSRASLGYIKSKIDLLPEELENLELAVKEFYIKGLIPLIYSKKTIFEKENKDLLEKLNILKYSPINHSEEIKLLISDFEKELSFIGIIGIKDKINDGIAESLSFFQKIDQRIWIVSGDSRDNCLSTALSLKFIKFNEHFYELESENKSKLLLNIQNHLEDIKEKFFSIGLISNQVHETNSILKPSRKSGINFFKVMANTLKNSIAGVSYILENKYILLNGNSLDIIMKDDYLRLNFVFLISLIKKFVCYNLSPTHKALLVELVQNKLMNNPKALAIGDGWNDALMLQKASFGIEYVNLNKFNKNEGLMNAGDMQISNLKLIKNLMLFEGFISISVMEQIVLYFFYKSYLTFYPLFLFNWYCNFTATSLYNKGFLIFTDWLLSLHNVIVFFLYEKPIGTDFLEKFPSFYKDSRTKKHHIVIRFFLRAALEAFLQGSFIFYGTFLSCSNSIGPGGKDTGFEMASSALVFSLCIVSNLKIFLESQNKKSKLMMTLFPKAMAIILIIFFFSVKFVCSLFTCYTAFLDMGFKEFVINTNIFICIIGNIIFSFASHFLIKYILNEKLGGYLYFSFLNAKISKKREILKNIKGNIP